MTHHTDAELLPCPFCGGKAEAKKPDMSYEFTLIKCQECDAQTDEGVDFEDAAEAWNRRAPSASVPQGWKLVPEESTEAMARAFRADDAPYYFAMTTIRCNDFAERWRAVIAAAPKPPDAEPVQLPEPYDYVEWRERGFSKTQKTALYTEHQVRQLLAKHGIK